MSDDPNVVEGSGPRCIVELGELRDPRSVRLAINSALRGAIELRTEITSYLEDVGVVLDRTSPKNWFMWVDEADRVFMARCSEPEGVGPVDAKGSPSNKSDTGTRAWNYYIIAQVYDRRRIVRIEQRATAIAFYHEAQLPPALVERKPRE